MDYKEKFEDFLDKMQGLLDNAKKQGHIIVRVEDLENALTELKEGNDDERIRKSLIEYFRWNVQQLLNDFSNKDVVAWLEKQGEQKHVDKAEPKSHKGSYTFDGIDKEILNAAILFAMNSSDEFACNSVAKEDVIDWLKSIKERIGWKPSDEQMIALSEASGIVGMLTPRGMHLQSLYNDLKKLTE